MNIQKNIIKQIKKVIDENFFFDYVKPLFTNEKIGEIHIYSDVMFVYYDTKTIKKHAFVMYEYPKGKIKIEKPIIIKNGTAFINKLRRWEYD